MLTAPLTRQASSSGGSIDSEVHELTVVPHGRPSIQFVTTTTPLAKRHMPSRMAWPMASRSAMSAASEPIGSVTRAGLDTGGLGGMERRPG